ncbi:MAG: hypothetical protein M1817_000184 [Caeruleum heppii]|nr:MAG: hypothetical protein M1817_000184 [Caeruleum heppii]
MTLNMSPTGLLTSGLSILGMSLLFRLLQYSKQSKIIPSPRTTLLPRLSPAASTALPYPPDVIPGARDVNSPYGTFRLYEWGHEGGRKVLLVHGITTPCVALADVAKGLVRKGCRVMLMDLWGRGYSDTPADLNHDIRLYSTQILLAITSSPLSWTGNGEGFSLVGYSLGGGIAASFTAQFPNLVRSLVLLAPAGLIRPAHFSKTNIFLYSSGLIPEPLLLWLVKRRLRQGTVKKSVTGAKGDEATTAMTAELPDDAEETPEKSGSASVARTDHFAVSPAATVAWQLDHHAGFVVSFLSSVRHAPISAQHDDWARIGTTLASNSESSAYRSGAQGLENGKVLVVLGETDPIIVREEIMEDATRALGGDGHVAFNTIDAGHEFPVTKSEEVVRHVSAFWGLG